ncbi:MAG: VOC family protein [Actinomycetota bacterium]|nr:VOC family protein [Actinomycetota bacterium]
MAAASPLTSTFGRLDFLYMPSRDVAADRTYFVSVLGGREVFAIEGMGTRVAAVEIGTSAPLLLFADHVDGEAPILVYRVNDLDAALTALEERGWEREAVFEIPHGPCCSFRTPGGYRVALYQLIRPEAAAHFEGRRDF